MRKIDRTAPILIIEHDEDDQTFIRQALQELGIKYPAVSFSDGGQALAYLKTMPKQPFLILCDIEMPVLDGLELRRAIDADESLRRKSIPFVYFTDYKRKDLVDEAYDLTVQGYFIKAHRPAELQEQLQCIIAYWEHCVHPNHSDLN